MKDYEGPSAELPSERKRKGGHRSVETLVSVMEGEVGVLRGDE